MLDRRRDGETTLAAYGRMRVPGSPALSLRSIHDAHCLSVWASFSTTPLGAPGSWADAGDLAQLQLDRGQTIAGRLAQRVRGGPGPSPVRSAHPGSRGRECGQAHTPGGKGAGPRASYGQGRNGAS